MRNIVTIALVAVLIATSLFVYFVGPPNRLGVQPNQDMPVEDARQYFQAGDYQQSLQLASAFLAARKGNPQSTSKIADAAMIAGESATKLNQLHQALEYYALVPSSSPEAATAQWASAEIYFHLGRLTPTFEALELSLELDPELAYAHERMIDACNVVSRRHESLPHLMFMVRSDRIRPDYLMLLGNLDKETGAAETLEQFRSRSPNDLLPNLGLARFAISEGEFQTAIDLLRPLLKQQPKLIEAHVQLGRCWLQAAPERLNDWNLALPSQADDHPDIWFIRGEWLRLETRHKAAIRCFAEAILRDANHLKSHQALAQLLQLQGQVDQAAMFAEKAELLQKINISLEQFYDAKTHTPLMEVLAELTLRAGRVWESLGWCGYAKSIDSSLTWPEQIANQATSQFQISPTTPHTLPVFNLVRGNQYFDQIPLADFSAPDFAGEKEQIIDESPVLEGSRFRDVAEDAGLDFRFDNNLSNQHEGRYIFEITGGGVGVLDFDADGLPDLFFAQGGAFPNRVGNGSSQDMLFRLVESGPVAYESVSRQARLTDTAFGQGVAIGDVDADGFDDIFVCNVGENHLWLNAGDGTFLDVSSSLPADSSWTCSAAIVDLNFDGLSEIYEANYVSGSDVFTKMCEMDGRLRSCSPLVFSPTQDRVLLSDDAGRFQDAEICDEMVGNGMGVVAFLLEDAELPSIFVGVDQQPNIFGTVLAKPDNGHLGIEIKEEAIVRGLAYDNAGNAQACMGIAASDANADGSIDLFVTNFYLEYYTLYLQEEGLFRDATASSNTIPDTRSLLGFGTQFLDVQLDGHQDLFVLNGHIDNHSHMGIPEKMPSQLFLGSGDAKFASVAEAGDYFHTPRLGRALAKLDFDRDGMTDVVSTDLELPANLIHNESIPKGSFVKVRLVGTKSDRNAFCGSAELALAERGSASKAVATTDFYRQSRQLVAGGGYQATNERVLHFSIPDKQIASRDFVLSLEIQWPSGIAEVHHGLTLGEQYTAVENQGLYLTP